MDISDIKFDCLHFMGAFPCIPNKEHNVTCKSCEYYKPSTKRILIIKYGAIGDVIRSTPLIVKYRELYPDCHITWLTDFPEILPKEDIEVVNKLNGKSLYTISQLCFDIAVNLEKDVDACLLLSNVTANNKYGFIWEDNHISVTNKATEAKLITGLFDNLSKLNTKSYMQEIFEICELEFNHEPYLLPLDSSLDKKWSLIREKAAGRTIVGLNTGCGKRWKTRLWPKEHWLGLVKELLSKGYFPVILGGPEEKEKNEEIARQSNAYYPGVHSLSDFIAIMNNCDVIVTAVSMAMHITLALKKRIVLFNNIFNKNEFDLYGLGEIVEPSTGCDCFYGLKCKREKHCMNDISVDIVLNAIENQTQLL